MKPSPRARQLAAVLVVVFLLSTLWASYYLYAATRPSAAGTSGTPVATYSESSVGSFVAAVDPSYLFNNSTTVYGGNVNLFTPITNWINASIRYTLDTNRTAAISLDTSLAVALTTATWSKTLYTAFNNSSWPDATVATLAIQYAINVSYIVALANAIDAQLDYYGVGYTLSLVPVVTGSLEVAGVQESVSSEPRLNFTFAGSLISPSGLAYASTGTLFEPAAPTTPSSAAGAIPYLAVVGSVGGLGGSAWVATRRSDEEPRPSMEDLLRPYEEAVAEVNRLPDVATIIPVSEFSDLVKIADTLGKPLLRPAEPDPDRPTLLVLDGTVAYSYRYPGISSATAGSLISGTSAGDADRPVTSARAVERLQGELGRLQRLSLDDSTATRARQRASRALYLIRAGHEEEASAEIDALSRLLTHASNPSSKDP